MIKTDTYNFFRQFFRGAIHYGVGGFLSKIFVFINVSIILAFVDPYQYGVYKLSFSLYLIVNGLLLSGLNGLVLNDVVSYKSLKEENKAKRLFTEYVLIKIILGLIALFVFFFFSNLIAEYYSAGISVYLKIFSVLFIVDALLSTIETYFRITLDFLGSNLTSVSFEVSKSLILSYFIFLSADGLNIVNLCITAVMSSILSLTTISFYAYNRGINNLFTGNFRGPLLMFGLIRTYGKWAIAKNYISTFVENIRLWIVKIFVSTEAVAIFSVAMSLLATLKKIIPTQSISSLIPSYIKDPITLRNIYARVTKFFVWIFILLLFIGYVIVPSLVTLIAPKYLDSLVYFKIIIFSIIFSSMILNKQIIYSFRRQKFLFSLTSIEFASIFVFGVILTSQFGLYGISLELLITEFIIFFIVYRYLLKIQPSLSLSLKDIFRFNHDDKEMIRVLWHKVVSRLSSRSNEK